LTDDVTQMRDIDYLSLIDWLDFYRKDYPKVGLVIDGAFYDRNGREKNLLKQLKGKAEVIYFRRVQYLVLIG